jgi:hypothetical protein
MPAIASVSPPQARPLLDFVQLRSARRAEPHCCNRLGEGEVRGGELGVLVLVLPGVFGISTNHLLASLPIGAGGDA